MTDGGYDAGYLATDCFWGTEAASLVRKFLTIEDPSGYEVLDVGCGEGKNANAFASAGSRVVAIDCSEAAIANGKRLFDSRHIDWCVGDAASQEWAEGAFDVVVGYGLFHCLPDSSSAEKLIERLQRATKPGGYNIFARSTTDRKIFRRILDLSRSFSLTIGI